MPSVLITRPQAASELMAEALAERGFECVIEPMLDIRPTHVPPPDTATIQAVMITSANAVAALDLGDYEAEKLLGFPCFCVGPQTAEKARQAGFTSVKHGTADGHALADMIADNLHDKSKAILHIAAREADSKAQQALQAQGFTTDRWPIYDAVAATSLSPYCIRRIHEGTLDAITVFSVRTAQTLLGLLRQNNLEAACASITAIAISPAVRNALVDVNWRNLLAAEQPLEQSVLDTLAENIHHHEPQS